MTACPSNILIGFPNRIDQAVSITGGNWVPSLPLANLQNRLFSRVARSANLDPASTTFVLDMGEPRATRIIAFVAHNMGLTAKVRIEAAASPTFTSPVYDSGTTDVWTGLLSAEWNINELEWESDNYWIGTYSKEEIQGFTATSTHILPEVVSARYWRVRITDTANDDGYVQIGRMFIGPAWQPEYNMSYGASLGYETQTAVETALGGAEFFDPREPVRVMRFGLNYMRDEEAWGRALELTRRAGIHREVFIVADPTDEFQGLRRNFMGRLRTLSPLEQAMYNLNAMPFEVKELR